MQHLIFVNWWIRGFVVSFFWCHEQVKPRLKNQKNPANFWERSALTECEFEDKLRSQRIYWIFLKLYRTFKEWFQTCREALKAFLKILKEGLMPNFFYRNKVNQTLGYWFSLTSAHDNPFFNPDYLEPVHVLPQNLRKYVLSPQWAGQRRIIQRRGGQPLHEVRLGK